LLQAPKSCSSPFWLGAPNNSIEKLGGTEMQQKFKLIIVLSKQFTFPQRIVHQETDLIIQYPQIANASSSTTTTTTTQTITPFILLS
jgi:hypothetical protein